MTFHTAVNYGAVLQSYALCTFLNKYSEATIINYSPTYFDKIYRNPFYIKKCKGINKKFRCLVKWTILYNVQKKRYRKMLMFNQFISELPLKGSMLDKQSLKELENSYDMVIVGSDQVWNMKISNYEKAYVLDFVPAEKRFCYAASFGKDNISDNDKKYLEPEILHFKNYYVRENSGVKILKENYNISAEVVVDPTALLSMDEWNKIALRSKLHKKDFILIYLAVQPTQLLDAAIQYASKKGKDILIIGERKIKYKGAHNLIDVSPYDFVQLVKNCECFFTTSFHGIMFSLIYNKNFYYELDSNPINNNARIIDLISQVHLSNRNVDNGVEDTNINWHEVNLLFNEHIRHSKELLLKLIS